MTPNPYVPKVGDTVRSPEWALNAEPVVVSAVGRKRLLAVHPTFGEDMYDLDIPWVKVEPTPADRYAVYANNGRYHSTFDNERDAVAWIRDYTPRGRVARFSFAEWVES